MNSVHRRGLNKFLLNQKKLDHRYPGHRALKLNSTFAPGTPDNQKEGVREGTVRYIGFLYHETLPRIAAGKCSLFPSEVSYENAGACGAQCPKHRLINKLGDVLMMLPFLSIT